MDLIIRKTINILDFEIYFFLLRFFNKNSTFWKGHSNETYKYVLINIAISKINLQYMCSHPLNEFKKTIIIQTCLKQDFYSFINKILVHNLSFFFKYETHYTTSEPILNSN